MIMHKKVAVVDSMTSAEFIRIVDEVAEQLVAREVKFRSINGVQRRMGKDGFNWMVGLDPDAPDLKIYIEACADYIAGTGHSIVFSKLETARGVAAFDSDSFWDKLRIPAARGVYAWDLIEGKFVNRIDFLFMPEMFP